MKHQAIPFRFFSVLILFLQVFITFAQNEFVNGYFIAMNGERIECQLLDEDWRSTPKRFTYKINGDAENRTGTVQDVKEFGVQGLFRFINSEVQIDRSNNRVGRLSNTRSPEFQAETLFLEVLVSGYPSLYYFRDVDLIRFFYQMGNGPIVQLVHKRYRTESIAIKENNQFRQQLKNDVQSCNHSEKEIAYQKKDLVNYIVGQNECKTIEYIVYDGRKKKTTFHLKLQSGVRYATLESYTGDRVGLVEYDSKITPHLGVEFEFVLPFNNNKSSVFIAPHFQSFKKSVVMTNVINENVLFEADYKSIELPLGARYYFFLSKNNQVFIDLLYSFDFSLNSSISNLNISTNSLARNNVSAGFGFSRKDFSTELRYSFKNDLLGEYIFRHGDYRRLSLVIGYRLF